MRNQSEPPSLAAIKTPISQEAFDQLFREARTHSTWLPEPVPVELLRKAYELARLGPTSANGSPARFVFLTTPAAKARLKPVLAPGNVEKTMAAPVTVIIAWDTEFHENLPKLFPQADVRLRRRQTQCGILRGWQMEGQPSLQSRLWRPEQALSTQSSAEFRGSICNSLEVETRPPSNPPGHVAGV